MLDGSTQVVEATQIDCTENDWSTIDRKLRRIAKRRRALDREEATWLLKAERARVHTRFDCGSFFEYLEQVFGYGPEDRHRSDARGARARNPTPPPEKTIDDDVHGYLVNVGFSPREARDATARARAHVEADPPTETLLRAALRELHPSVARRVQGGG